MIAFFLVAAAAAAAPPVTLKSCTEQAKAAPERAAAAAETWAAKGGGADARLCQGLALAGLERWTAAAAAFEQAAAEAARRQDRRRADFWIEAGNAWLAANEPARAIKAFDAALAANLLAPQLQGEVHLDRARAEVASANEAGARLDLDKALALVPGDGFAWYLSAALARRQNDLARARNDIAKAVSLAPDDAAILLEAGNIAGASGEPDGAKGLWERALRAAPDSPAGKAAKAALAANPDAPIPPR
ncbi:MAG TPA: tetratricopeptide repeat protein [Allosphingosinicella sp.]|jgi:tetratricopeptide (TPR) repeat protein